MVELQGQLQGALKVKSHAFFEAWLFIKKIFVFGDKLQNHMSNK